MDLWRWIFPISSGAADATARLAIKQSDMHNFLLSGIGLLFGMPFYAAYLFIEGMPSPNHLFWIAALGHVPCYVLVMIFTVEAHRAGTMLKTMPYASLTPALLLITSPLMGGGTPNVVGTIGILILVVGLYVLNIEQGQENWRKPIKAIFFDRGAQCMFGATLVVALSANLDKMAVQNGGVPLYLIVDHGLTAIILLLLLPIYLSLGILKTKSVVDGKTTVKDVHAHDILKELSTKKHYVVFAWFGLTNAATSILHNVGLKIMPHVPYFISGKRVGSILCAIALGLLMSRREKRHSDAPGKFSTETHNLGWKLLGTGVIIIGMLMIILKGGNVK